MAERGGQLGNNNAAKGTQWRDAINAVFKRAETEKDRRRMLITLAEKLVDMAMEGDMAAIKEIGDRLDGKPKISMDLNATMTMTDIGVLANMRQATLVSGTVITPDATPDDA